MLPRHSDVRRRWDGFPTRVLSARGMWAPTAMSHRGRRLRPMLPKARDCRYLSVSGVPEHAEAQVPFSGNWVRWTGAEIPSGCA
jgi:hypothetical protein